MMVHHFPEEPDVGTGCLVRSTSFGYRPGEAVGEFLVEVTQHGHRRVGDDGYVTRSLPPLELEYSQPGLHDEVREIGIPADDSYQWGRPGRGGSVGDPGPAHGRLVPLRGAAQEHLRELVSQAATAGSMRLLSVRHEFPTEWARFTAAELDGDGTAPLTLTLREEHYPYWARVVAPLGLHKPAGASPLALVSCRKLAFISSSA